VGALASVGWCRRERERGKKWVGLKTSKVQLRRATASKETIEDRGARSAQKKVRYVGTKVLASLGTGLYFGTCLLERQRRAPRLTAKSRRNDQPEEGDPQKGDLGKKAPQRVR
jgi:hypothetical protein